MPGFTGCGHTWGTIHEVILVEYSLAMPVALGPVALAAQRAQHHTLPATVILIKIVRVYPLGSRGCSSKYAGNSYATVMSVVPANVCHNVGGGSPDIMAHCLPCPTGPRGGGQNEPADAPFLGCERARLPFK